jgi:curved DNA-binding protein CbpA
MANPHHSEDPYKILDLEHGATEIEIKHAYFSKVREHSPERDPAAFKRIRAAYEMLRSSGERAKTDLFMIDEGDARFEVSMLQRFENIPPLLTKDLIDKDLLALEAFLLWQELIGRNGPAEGIVGKGRLTPSQPRI